MKISILLFAALSIVSVSNAQKFFTKTAKITFEATALKSPENIDAVNKNSICVIDAKTGDIQFSVLMKGFEFERALMMEHFNENYVESDKFNKTTFKGTIINNESINYTKDGVYSAKVKGKLEMHGQSKDFETEGKIIVKAGKIQVSANFNAQFDDFKIVIPQLVADKVAKFAKISVDCTLDPLSK